jgi:hypothetical protein
MQGQIYAAHLHLLSLMVISVLITVNSLLGQCPCVATGTYNISINYIRTYVLYSYEIDDDICELSEMTSKRNSGL